MPDGDAQPVAFGRWQEAHRALEGRVAVLEAAAGKRRDRMWMLMLAALSGLALPVVVLLVATVIHRALG